MGRHEWLGFALATLLILVSGSARAERPPDAGEPPPARQEIVFESARDGHTEIYVMRADGSDQRRLTHTVGGARRSTLPHWSPDRRKIAYSTGANHRM